MHVYGPAHLHGAQPVAAPHAARLTQTSAPAASSPIQDELQLSAPGLDVSRLVEKAGQLPEIRQDRVNQIRAQIAAGTYETDEKLGIALGRLMNELG